MNAHKTRYKAALLFALKHLFFSILVAALVAFVVFQIWFPYPFRELAGGKDLFWLIVCVDVVCGPLLSLVLYNPVKSKKELFLDLSIVVLIQLAALAYGLFSLYNARPVAMVFEVDRFRAVVMADIPESDQVESHQLNIKIPAWGVENFGIREAKNTDENLQSIDLGLQGIEPSMRPQWWTPYSQTTAAVLKKAKPVDVFKAKYPQSKAEIEKAIKATGLQEEEIVWLPLVSRRSSDWTVFINKKTALPVAYIGLSGF
jgi:hypothetical protein